MVHKVAERVIFVNMPWRVMFWRTFWRSLDRIWNKRVLWNGNVENWRDVFFSRDSFMVYLIKSRKHFRGRRKDRIYKWSNGGQLIDIEGRRALNQFYDGRELSRG